MAEPVSYLPPADADLDEFLAGPEPDWEAEPTPAESLNDADHKLYRLSRVLREIAETKRVAAVRIAEIERWRDYRLGKLGERESWLRASLRRFHEAVLMLDDKRKSIVLPTGRLTSRAGQRTWTLDEPTVLAWVLPDEVRKAIENARHGYQRVVDDLISADPVAKARLAGVKIGAPPAPEVSLSGVKALGTRRDEKDKAVAWGVDADGVAIPGVTVTTNDRTFDIDLTRPEEDELDLDLPDVEETYETGLPEPEEA